MECRDEGRHRVDAREQRRIRREPDALGLVRRRGQVERRRVDHAAVGDRLPLVRHDLLGDVDPSMVELDAGDAPAAQRRDDRGLGLLPRLRVPVDGYRADERRSRLEVEGGDAVRLAEVQVDRTRVHRREGAFALRRAEQRPGRLVHDDERLGVARPERQPCGRRVAPSPDVAGGSRLELRKDGRSLERLGPEHRGVCRRERPLVGGREHVPVEDPRRPRVDQRRLDAPP